MKRVMIIGNRESGCHVNYYNAVEAAGAEPYPCPVTDAVGPGGGGMDAARLAAVEAAVADADGIVIPGGCDVNPALYGEQNTASRDVNTALDALEEAVLAAAVRRRTPVLGICRGLQIINVFFGGSLIQDVADCSTHERVGAEDKVHDTAVRPESFLHDLYGADTVRVNSAHHQAIHRLGAHLKPLQYCGDGLIEAVEHDSLPIVAFQWHPERMCLGCARADTVDGLCVFRYFVGIMLR